MMMIDSEILHLLRNWMNIRLWLFAYGTYTLLRFMQFFVSLKGDAKVFLYV